MAFFNLLQGSMRGKLGEFTGRKSKTKNIIQHNRVSKVHLTTKQSICFTTLATIRRICGEINRQQWRLLQPYSRKQSICNFFTSLFCNKRIYNTINGNTTFNYPLQNCLYDLRSATFNRANAQVNVVTDFNYNGVVWHNFSVGLYIFDNTGIILARQVGETIDLDKNFFIPQSFVNPCYCLLCAQGTDEKNHPYIHTQGTEIIFLEE